MQLSLTIKVMGAGDPEVSARRRWSEATILLHIGFRRTIVKGRQAQLLWRDRRMPPPVPGYSPNLRQNLGMGGPAAHVLSHSFDSLAVAQLQTGNGLPKLRWANGIVLARTAEAGWRLARLNVESALRKWHEMHR